MINKNINKHIVHNIRNKNSLINMPFFKQSNLLYLHVPKTGGMSIEEYFFTKENVEKNEKSIYGWYFDRENRIRVPNERSLQHFTYEEIMKHQ